jgi:hypothetical protein
VSRRVALYSALPFSRKTGKARSTRRISRGSDSALQPLTAKLFFDVLANKRIRMRVRKMNGG